MARLVGYTADELKTRERVFEGLTSKAVRLSVRALTANLQRIITSGFDPSQPRDSQGKWTDDPLGDAYSKGFTVDEAVQGGLGSLKLEKLTLSNGTKVYRKTTPSKMPTDREVAAGKILNALGVNDFHVSRTGENQFIVTNVEGTVGKKAVDDAVAGGKSIRDAYINLVSRPGGKQIALVDWLTSNGDRNLSNVVVTPDGKVAGFDHGDSAFIDYGVPSSPFVSYWMDPEATGIKPRFTAAELADVRRRLEELRDDFAAEGHADWHDTVMKRLAQLENAPLTSAAAPTLSNADMQVLTATWNQHVENELFPYLVQTFVDSAADIHADLEDLTDESIPKVSYDFATQYLRGAANRMVGIGDVLWDNMREQLAEGYQLGETTQELATRVRSVAKISESRAVMIARTEIVPAANFASLHQVQLAGFTDDECQKGWLATEDSRTRPEHHAADNQRVPLSKPFKVGGELLNFPGDWSLGASADNVINCRCSIEFVFDDDITVADAAFEAKHPRADDGRFGDKAANFLKNLLFHEPYGTNSDLEDIEVPADAVDQFAANFSGRFAGLDVGKIEVKWINHEDKSYGGESTFPVGLEVTGEIFKDKKRVGNFIRIFYTDATNGDLTVDHAYLNIDSTMQGQGFAREFNNHNIEWYRREGVKMITLEANISVGGYAWAVADYQWRGTAEDDIFQRFEEVLANKYSTELTRLGDRYDEQVTLARNFLEKWRKSSDVTPLDVAKLGRWQGAGKNDWWIGKSILMTIKSSWWGELAI